MAPDAQTSGMLEEPFIKDFLEPTLLYSKLSSRSFCLQRNLAYARPTQQNQSNSLRVPAAVANATASAGVSGSASWTGSAASSRFLSLRISGLVDEAMTQRNKRRKTVEMSPISASLLLEMPTVDGASATEYILLETHRTMVPVLSLASAAESSKTDIDFRLDFGMLSWHSQRCILVLHRYERCLAARLAGFRSCPAAGVAELPLKHFQEALEYHQKLRRSVLPNTSAAAVKNKSKKPVWRSSEQTKSKLCASLTTNNRLTTRTHNMQTGCLEAASLWKNMLGPARVPRPCSKRRRPDSSVANGDEISTPQPLAYSDLPVWGYDCSLHTPDAETDAESFSSNNRAETGLFRAARPRCILPGNYVVHLRADKASGAYRENPSDQYSKSFALVDFGAPVGPCVQFEVQWSGSRRSPLAWRARERAARSAALIRALIGSSRIAPLANAPCVSSDVSRSPSPRPPVFYDFVYCGNVVCKSEVRQTFDCPWCSVDLHNAQGLACHLLLTHSRFFCFEGSLDSTGSPRLKVTRRKEVKGALKKSQVGRVQISTKRRVQLKPVQLSMADRSRFQYYYSRELSVDSICAGLDILGTAPSETTQSKMSDVVNIDDKVGPQGMTIRKNGSLSSATLLPHQTSPPTFVPLFLPPPRQYYHSKTCAKLTPYHVEHDSDDDCDEGWVLQQSDILLDEFEDITPSEKAFMKLWNRHVQSCSIRADRHVASSCAEFVRQNGRIIIAKGLRQTLAVHLVNLMDQRLINHHDAVRDLKTIDEMALTTTGIHSAKIFD